MKSTPNLPASSRMKNPSGGGPQIKNALKGKAIEMAKAEIGVDKNTKVKIRTFPEKKDGFEEFIKTLTEKDDENSEAKANTYQVLGKILGIETSFTKQLTNELPTNIKTQLDYNMQLLNISKKEKALIAIPNEFYVR